MGARPGSSELDNTFVKGSFPHRSFGSSVSAVVVQV